MQTHMNILLSLEMLPDHVSLLDGLEGGYSKEIMHGGGNAQVVASGDNVPSLYSLDPAPGQPT